MHLLRILLVDDSREFLESAARFLSMRQKFQIIGQAVSGQDAIDQVEALNPDLVLMDLAMPGMNGLEASRQIKMRPLASRVIIMTLYDVAEYRDAAQAVADGFVTKTNIRSHLLPLIDELFPQLAA